MEQIWAIHGRGFIWVAIGGSTNQVLQITFHPEAMLRFCRDLLPKGV